MKPHARLVSRSRMMARPMSRLEWLVHLLRSPEWDRDPGWLRYMAEQERRAWG